MYSQVHRLHHMFSCNSIYELNPGQMDLQVVASGRKLNLPRDLRWVAKQTCKLGVDLG